MPNGRPSTIPGPASRRCGCFCFCGGVLATIPMLRGVSTRRVDPGRRVASCGARRGIARVWRALLFPRAHPRPLADRAINVGGMSYGSGVDETAAVLVGLPGSPEAEAPADKPRGPAL